MSGSVFPAIPEPTKLELADERLKDLLLDLTEVKVMAEQAKDAMDDGDFAKALEYLDAAKKPADIVAARRKWAELAVTAARDERVGAGG